MVYLKKTLLIRTVVAILIIIAVSLVICYFDNKWISSLYAITLALFPDEIKTSVKKLFNTPSDSRTRVVCAYLFRIMCANKYYLLVDERGENMYVPVGGVYKFDNNFDIGQMFEGESDVVHGINDDTDHDLRLTISSRLVDAYFNWFEQGTHRENVNDLTREFREEVIDTGLLPKSLFSRLTYVYIGSHKVEQKNERLRIPEILRHDVFCVQLSEEQQIAIKKLLKTAPQNCKYILATQEEIASGSCDRGGVQCNISSAAKLVLVNNVSALYKVASLKGTYSPKIV